MAIVRDLFEDGVRSTTTGTANTATAAATAVPADTVRYVYASSVHITAGGPLDLNVEILSGSDTIGVGSQSAASATHRVATPRGFWMNAGEQLQGRADAAPGVGNSVVLTQWYVDFTLDQVQSIEFP